MGDGVIICRHRNSLIVVLSSELSKSEVQWDTWTGKGRTQWYSYLDPTPITFSSISRKISLPTCKKYIFNDLWVPIQNTKFQTNLSYLLI